MTESKITLTERLRREGRWEEASRFKDTVIKECRARGVKKSEAAEHAWEEMAKAFPPLPPAERLQEPLSSAQPATDCHGQSEGAALDTPPGPEEDVDFDALLERDGDRQSPDLARDVLWVYRHLSNRKAKPEDAPSLGAWNLLQWARKYQNRFFEQLLPKAMAVHTGEASEDEKRERTRIEEMKAILQQMREQEAAPSAGGS